MTNDDDGLIHDSEGAKILGLNNPMDGEPTEQQIEDHLFGQMAEGAEVFAQAAKLAQATTGNRRIELLLGAQDALIHLLIDAHTLLHLTRRDG